jgi:ribosomal protein S14
MKASKYKNTKFRKLFFKSELLQKSNKFLLINLLNNSSIKKGCFLFINILRFFFKRILFTKIKLNNKCVYTGKSNAFENRYSISRLVLRNLFQYGILPGYRKAVW